MLDSALVFKGKRIVIGSGITIDAVVINSYTIELIKF